MTKLTSAEIAQNEILEAERLKEERRDINRRRKSAAQSIDRVTYSHSDKVRGIKAYLVNLTNAKSVSQFSKGAFETSELLKLVPSGASIDKQRLASLFNTSILVKVLKPKQYRAITLGLYLGEDVSTKAILDRLLYVACLEESAYQRTLKRGADMVEDMSSTIKAIQATNFEQGTI